MYLSNFGRSPQEDVELTDLSIRSFSENLKELKNLKSLSMNFNGYPFEKTLINLHPCRSPKMTGASLIGLAREINENLSLSTLSLSFKR